jgi:hypothetical protein
MSDRRIAHHAASGSLLKLAESILLRYVQCRHQLGSCMKLQAVPERRHRYLKISSVLSVVCVYWCCNYYYFGVRCPTLLRRWLRVYGSCLVTMVCNLTRSVQCSYPGCCLGSLSDPLPPLPIYYSAFSALSALSAPPTASPQPFLIPTQKTLRGQLLFENYVLFVSLTVFIPLPSF